MIFIWLHMDKNEIASCSLNTETIVLVNKRLSVRRHGNKLAGSDGCVELKVYSRTVRLVWSRTTIVCRLLNHHRHALI